MKLDQNVQKIKLLTHLSQHRTKQGANLPLMTNIFGEAGLSDMQTRKLVKLRIYTYELKKNSDQSIDAFSSYLFEY